MERETGSYRDPGGYVFYDGEAVYRAVLEPARANYEYVRSRGSYADLAGPDAIAGSRELPQAEAGALAPEAAYVLAHDRVPFISYPYEWPFALLKKAALFHLSLQRRLLEADIALSDATAFNVQFDGVRPVFIDHLSLCPYAEGDLWRGQHQFMEQFVHPLLLTALAGVPYNNWYKGNLDGIRGQDLVNCLPLRRRWSPKVFKHVVLPQMLEAEYRQDVRPGRARASAGPPKAALGKLLETLSDWVAGLSPRGVGYTTWSNYETTRTYRSAELDEKRAHVGRFVAGCRPGMLWDIGCNTGEFSEIALAHGAGRVIGFDLDHGALDLACARAEKQGLAFLPLAMDFRNPSTDCGWRGRERKALDRRDRPDAVIALAVIHHLAIGGNVPLEQAVDWLVSLAPTGMIEFVHKHDTTVQTMLQFREDIFGDYRAEAFEAHLARRARIVARHEISEAGRTLYVFDRS